jgi:hypothetical protein
MKIHLIDAMYHLWMFRSRCGYQNCLPVLVCYLSHYNSVEYICTAFLSNLFEYNFSIHANVIQVVRCLLLSRKS